MINKNILDSKVKGLAVELSIDLTGNTVEALDFAIWRLLREEEAQEIKTCLIDDYLTLDFIVKDAQHKDNIDKKIKKLIKGKDHD